MQISVGVTRVVGERDDLANIVGQDIQQAGFSYPLISYDKMGDENIGPYGNFRKCLQLLIDDDNYHETSSDAYLVLQDDIRLSKNLYQKLSIEWHNQLLGVGCISLYCAAPHHREEVGWFPM